MTKPTHQILTGDCRETLKTLPDQSVHCVVTSPPYFALRDYGVDGQIGLESSPAEYIAEMVGVFREIRRVLRDNGTVWINLGDSFVSNKHHGDGLKPKDLCGIPWRVAFALQADGWYLRQDIIYSKPNPMPESVTDRCTKSHEYIFLLTKEPRYFYDADAVREPASPNTNPKISQKEITRITKARESGCNTSVGTGRCGGETHLVDGMVKSNNSYEKAVALPVSTRNKRSVWTVTTSPFKAAHFATYPPALIEPCILAGTSEKGCCPECGAPWIRVTKKVDTGRIQKAGDGWDQDEGTHGTIHRNGRAKGKSSVPVMTSKTIGWKPTCNCSVLDGEPEDQEDIDPHNAIPCTVLDPFGGSATTAGVALAHGRNAITCELNPEYTGMMAARIKSIGKKIRIKLADQDGMLF